MANQQGSPADPGGPRTIRVFVSSTFRDMHAERDYLSRVAFPELRSRCLRHGVEFVGIDLRWGVTEEESRRQGALSVCLREIDHCRPFFLCLLGERYGWVPPPEEIPIDVMAGAMIRWLPRDLAEWYERDDTSIPPRYRLRRDPPVPVAVAEALVRAWDAAGLPEAELSITAREILRAAFAEDAPLTHAFFYLRRPGLADAPGFPATLVPTFVEPEASRRRRLQVMRERVRAAADRFVVRDYEVSFEGVRLDPSLVPDDVGADVRERVVSGLASVEDRASLSAPLQQLLDREGTVALAGLPALGDLVVGDLWTAIEREIARSGPAPDARERERAWHERFLVERTRQFLGRDRLVRAAVDGLDAGGEGAGQPLVLTGRAGSGKSAIVAHCALACRARWPERLVVPYFVGAAPGSTSLTAMLAALCRTSLQAGGLPEDLPADPDELRREWLTIVARAAAERGIVLLLDAVNQLHLPPALRQLGWIPSALPRGVSLLVSTPPGPELGALATRVDSSRIVHVPPLGASDRRALVESQLAARGKRLTDEQIARLLDEGRRPESGLPLYLLVAVEELSLFGSFAALDARIDRLPPDLPSLFEQVLMRLEQDHGRDLVGRIAPWLAISRTGLIEADVLDLLASHGESRRDRWVRFYRALEAYLRPLEEDSRGGTIDFFHDQLRTAVYRRYLAMPSPSSEISADAASAHRLLAGHFAACARDAAGGWTAARPDALGEVVFHQARSGSFEELADTLCDLEFIATRMRAGQGQGLLADYAIAEAAWPGGRERERIARLAEYGRALVASARDRDGGTVPEPPRPRPLESPTSDSGTAGTALDAIAAFRHFTASHFDRLVSGEEPVVQLAHNWARTGPVAEAAGRRLASGRGVGGPWVRSLTRRARVPSPACLMTLRGHRDFIWSMAVTPDGTRALTGANDGTIRTWDLATGESREFAAHHAGTTAVAISADGRRGVSAGLDVEQYVELRVWDLDTGESRVEGRADSYFRALAITPDGRRVASGHSDGSVRLWDLETGTGGRLGGHLTGVSAVAMTPDSRRIVSAGADKLVIVWDPSSGSSRELSGHARGVRGLVMTPDGRIAASAGQGRDSRVLLWNLDSGECREIASWAGSAIAIAADGRRVVYTGDALSVWDADRDESRVVDAGEGGVSEIGITADGTRAVTAGADGVIRVWDLEIPDAGQASTTAWSDTTQCAFAPDGRTAYLSGPAGLVTFDLASERAGGVPAGGAGMSSAIAVVPPGGRVLRAGANGLELLDVPANSARVLMNRQEAQDAVRFVAAAPDGRLAVSAGGDCLLRAWNLDDGSSRFLGSERDRVYALEMSPDGRRLVTGHGNGWLTVWELATGRSQRLHCGNETPVTGLVDDGRRIAAATLSGRLVTWRTRDGLRRDELEGAARALAATPDGGLVVASRAPAASEPPAPLRWRPAGSDWRDVGGPGGVFSALAVTPDGRHVVAARTDGRLLVKELETGRLVAAHTIGRTIAGMVARFPHVAVLLEGGGAELVVVEGWTFDAAARVEEAVPPVFFPVGNAGPSRVPDSSRHPAAPGGVWRSARRRHPGARASRAATILSSREQRTLIPPEERSGPPRRAARPRRAAWVDQPFLGPSGRPWRVYLR